MPPLSAESIESLPFALSKGIGTLQPRHHNWPGVRHQMGAVKLKPEQRDIVIFVFFVPGSSNREDAFMCGGAPSIPIAWMRRPGDGLTRRGCPSIPRSAIVMRQALPSCSSTPARVCGVACEKKSSDRQRFRICYCRRGSKWSQHSASNSSHVRKYRGHLSLSLSLSLFCTFTRFPRVQLRTDAVIARSYLQRRTLPTFGPPPQG